MARTGMNSDQAKRRVRIAKFAGLGLGVTAAALWALDVPGLSGAMPGKPVVSDLGPGEVETVVVLPVSIQNDAPLGIGERLDIAANRPAKPVEETVKPDVPLVTTTTETPWKYLGPIFQSTRTSALVSLEGKQRIVSEGSKVTIKTPEAEERPESIAYQAEVMKITPDYLEIKEEGGKLRRVELEARTVKVAWIKNMPTTVAGASMNGVPTALTPEARARLAAQGIDPQQIERARQATLAGRNRGAPTTPGDPAAAAALNRLVDIQRGTTRLTGAPSADGVVPMTDADVGAADAARKKKMDAEAAGVDH